MPHCNEKLGGFQKVRCIRMKGHEGRHRARWLGLGRKHLTEWKGVLAGIRSDVGRKGPVSMFSTSKSGAGMHRKEMKMGDRFLELLLSGMKRFVSALGTYWNRRTIPPPKVEQSETYTDQW